MEMTHRILAALLFFMLSLAVHAQDYDFGTVEALISDHKKMETKLAARTLLEYENKLKHQIAMDKTIEYDSIGKRLDNYIKCFEIIELLYTSGKIFMNAKNTYNDVVNVYMPRLKALNENYVERCLKKGSIMTSDSIIIKCYSQMVNIVLREGNNLITSTYDMILYTTGTTSCTRPELISIMRRINDSMEKIRYQIRSAYFTLWKYITIRTTFWKKSLYRAKSMGDICRERFEVWKLSAITKEWH